MEDAYARSTKEVLNFFGVQESKGLSDNQVKAALEKYGRNGTYYIFFPLVIPWSYKASGALLSY